MFYFFVAVEGHYLLLPLVVYKQESCVDFRTPYLNTTGTCLQFKYLQLYDDVEWAIEIYLRNENLDIVLIKTIEYSTSTSFEVARIWQMLFMRLPDSNNLQEVIIKIIRPANEDSGLAIDDFTIRPCSDFSKFIFLASSQTIREKCSKFF